MTTLSFHEYLANQNKLGQMLPASGLVGVAAAQPHEVDWLKKAIPEPPLQTPSPQEESRGHPVETPLKGIGIDRVVIANLASIYAGSTFFRPDGSIRPHSDLSAWDKYLVPDATPPQGASAPSGGASAPLQAPSSGVDNTGTQLEAVRFLQQLMARAAQQRAASAIGSGPRTTSATTKPPAQSGAEHREVVPGLT